MNDDALNKCTMLYTVVFLLILSMTFAGIGFAAFQKGYVKEMILYPKEREANINETLPQKDVLLAPNRILCRITDRRYYPQEDYLLLPNRQIVPGSSLIQEPATADQVFELYQLCQTEGRDFLYVLCPGKPLSDDDMQEYGLTCYRNENADAFLAKLAEYEIPFLDLRQTIRKATPEQGDPYDFFYMTDHHWSADAGLIAAREVAGTLNALYDTGMVVNAISPDAMRREVLEEPFVGETGKKLQGAFGTKDHLVVWTPADEPQLRYCDFQRSIDMTGDFSILFDQAQLTNRDGSMYYYFMGGNHNGFIENMDGGSSNILVIKDSMSCVVTPYLALSSGKVTFWDMRNDTEVVAYLQQHPEIRTVVVMYNISFALSKDMNAFF